MPANILIADDYDDNRELLRLMLGVEGFSVREARDGREFLAMAQNERPDVALIDISMPVLNGWETLREMRADTRTQSVPCIALTAFAADVDRRQALEAGFDAYVSKPFNGRDLIDAVRTLLKDKSLHDGDGNKTSNLATEPGA